MWGRRQQARAARRSGYLDGLLSTASAVAAGTTTKPVLTYVVSAQVVRVLGADSCRYVSGPLEDVRVAVLDRDGVVQRAGRGSTSTTTASRSTSTSRSWSGADHAHSGISWSVRPRGSSPPTSSGCGTGRRPQAHFDATVCSTGTDIWSPPPGDPGATMLFARSVYERGAMTLHALRREIGDQLFFQLLKRWAASGDGRPRTTADFAAMAESVAGRDLDPLLQSRLYGPRPPGLVCPG